MSDTGLDQEQVDGGAGGDAGESGGGDDEAGLGSVLAAPDATFVTAEKKPGNRGIFAMAGLGLLCAAGMYFMWARGGPSKAGAAAPAAEAAATKAANTTIKSFLTDDKDNVKKMRELLVNTQKVVKQFLAYPGKTQVPVEALQTNPFRLASSKSKAEADEAAEKKRLEDERVAALKAVQALELQSLIHSGSRRACMINNALYTEGQQVEGFTVEQIGTKAVIVRSGVYRFELTMQK